ncbi:MAG: hypothetical protein HY322_18560 [Betaproteobacteria bacterium]|nr:hypothetical protein [Betaproteobacteria bacterium]
MQEERYGTRDRTYSAWHRRLSTRRFVGIDRAQLLAMIDLDASLYVEYDDGTKEPVALIETTRDVGQDHKAVTVTRRLAVRAGLPCYLLLYTQGDTQNPADSRWRDITHFRIKRVWPRPEATWRTVAPGEWAQALLQIRAWAARRLDVQAANEPKY